MSSGRGHTHGAHGDHGAAVNAGNRRALWVVFVLISGFMFVEAVGGLLTGSLALLADAAHMLTDSLALGLALVAFWLSSRPATPNRSFGYQRAEILAALFNGVTLVAVSLWIFYEGIRRLQQPPEVLGGWMLVVAFVGLVVNVVGAVILLRTESESLNMQGALRHVLADLMGSLGAITAAGIILLTGWTYADPLVSLLIGALVLLSSRKLLRDSISILLEEAPRGLDAAVVGEKMVAIEGVREVHDLHLWTITSGFPALAAHVLVDESEDCHARRRDLEALLRREYDLTHTTLQVDHVADHASHGIAIQRRDIE